MVVVGRGRESDVRRRREVMGFASIWYEVSSCVCVSMGLVAVMVVVVIRGRRGEGGWKADVRMRLRRRRRRTMEWWSGRGGLLFGLGAGMFFFVVRNTHSKG